MAISSTSKGKTKRKTQSARTKTPTRKSRTIKKAPARTKRTGTKG